MNKSAKIWYGLLGLIFLAFGMLNLFSGFLGLLYAEPVLFITIGVESGFVDVDAVSERDFTLFMLLRVFIGIAFVFIGNSMLYTSTKQEFLHPRGSDMVRIVRRVRS